ncbi:MAG: YqeG family HAD IIIA-type phosphatase [Eubacterium sp.]|nr:YqeG family HAD IIIA-type phosphatase [Eubacterium sp.]
MKDTKNSRLAKFYPDEWVDSAYHIPYQDWYDKGKRGLIYDVDNTLVPHGAPATEESVALFKRLHEMGFKTLLISNNRKARVEPFAKAMETDFISLANKPFEKNYHAGCRMMGLSEEQVLFIGDQLFTDVWGAKKAGIYSILVDPINPKEEIQIVLKRRLEKVVLRKYLRDSGQKRSLGR